MSPPVSYMQKRASNIPRRPPAGKTSARSRRGSAFTFSVRGRAAPVVRILVAFSEWLQFEIQPRSKFIYRYIDVYYVCESHERRADSTLLLKMYIIYYTCIFTYMCIIYIGDGPWLFHRDDASTLTLYGGKFASSPRSACSKRVQDRTIRISWVSRTMI